eukprot:UN04651
MFDFGRIQHLFYTRFLAGRSEIKTNRDMEAFCFAGTLDIKGILEDWDPETATDPTKIVKQELLKENQKQT